MALSERPVDGCGSMGDGHRFPMSLLRKSTSRDERARHFDRALPSDWQTGNCDHRCAWPFTSRQKLSWLLAIAMDQDRWAMVIAGSPIQKFALCDDFASSILTAPIRSACGNSWQLEKTSTYRWTCLSETAYQPQRDTTICVLMS